MRSVGMFLMTLAAACGLWPACSGERRACTGMTMSGSIADQAAAFRLEVYGPSGTCADPGALQASTVAAKGSALKLKVDPGTHLFVVTAYADAERTTAIGRACVLVDVGPASQLCFDLTLASIDMSGASVDGADLSPIPSGDLGDGGGGAIDLAMSLDGADPDLADGPDLTEFDLVPPADLSSFDLLPVTCANEGSPCAGPSGGTCCSGICKDLDNDPDNCGGCGRACSMTSVDARRCAVGKCTSTCVAERGNCNQPTAPTADDGCEADLTVSISSCGGCGFGCNTTASNNSMRSCTDPGICQYTCAANRWDCSTSGANLDGCECEGTGCCEGGVCQTKHSNGVGGSFFDCHPLGLYDVDQAKAACAAFTGDIAKCAPDTCGTGGNIQMVCGPPAIANCKCWAYAAGTPGIAGHLAESGLCLVTGNPCPSAAGPSWQ